MVSDRETDDAAGYSVRGAVRPLVSALWRAVFGVCAVVVGVLTLLFAIGENTAESSAVFVLIGVAALLVGFVTISRLPKPTTEPTTETTTASTGGDEASRHADE